MRPNEIFWSIGPQRRNPALAESHYYEYDIKSGLYIAWLVQTVLRRGRFQRKC